MVCVGGGVFTGGVVVVVLVLEPQPVSTAHTAIGIAHTKGKDFFNWTQRKDDKKKSIFKHNSGQKLILLEQSGRETSSERR